jgi:hypothetical protein
MKKIISKQKNVLFVFCADPITLDKRAEWGNYESNFQQAPNGAFLRIVSETKVSHLVQPKEDKSAPIGWVSGDSEGLFNKAPIWIDDENILQKGDAKVLNTADGTINREAKEPSMICYNDNNGQPDKKDVWIQPIKEIEENYIM